MIHDALFPSRDDADKLLLWAHSLNPGSWAEHSRVVARAAVAIAEYSGLDVDRAYVSGILHDIGRYEGVRGLHHVYAGYALMMNKRYDAIAEICLSHSFLYQDLRAFGGGDWDCTAEELETIDAFLSTTIYNDYDRLIQLCDALGTPQGVCLMEKRLMDVARRHGFNDYTLQKWGSFFSLKDYFDAKCGRNIYSLFSDEICESVFGFSPPSP